MIRLRCYDRRDDVTAAAASAICEFLRAKPDAVIGLATGRTQEPLFAELLRLHRAGKVSFRQASFFHLDEYWRLPASSPSSMSHSLNRLFVSQTDAAAERFHRVDGMAPDATSEAARYESEIRRAGGIDLQLLGMGTNAHIGFNEPGSPHDSRMRLIRLTEETRHQNRDFFPAGVEVPSQALTMGIATILEAKSILILVTGRSKVEALRAALEGPIDPACPASALRHHPACTFLCDHDAAEGLTKLNRPAPDAPDTRPTDGANR